MGVRKPPKFITHHVECEDEPDDLQEFLNYINTRGITGYRAGCPCYSCNANRLYFKNIWKPFDKEKDV